MWILLFCCVSCAKIKNSGSFSLCFFFISYHKFEKQVHKYVYYHFTKEENRLREAEGHGKNLTVAILWPLQTCPLIIQWTMASLALGIFVVSIHHPGSSLLLFLSHPWVPLPAFQISSSLRRWQGPKDRRLNCSLAPGAAVTSDSEGKVLELWVIKRLGIFSRCPLFSSFYL